MLAQLNFVPEKLLKLIEKQKTKVRYPFVKTVISRQDKVRRSVKKHTGPVQREGVELSTINLSSSLGHFNTIYTSHASVPARQIPVKQQEPEKTTLKQLIKRHPKSACAQRPKTSGSRNKINQFFTT